MSVRNETKSVGFRFHIKMFRFTTAKYFTASFIRKTISILVTMTWIDLINIPINCTVCVDYKLLAITISWSISYGLKKNLRISQKLKDKPRTRSLVHRDSGFG